MDNYWYYTLSAIPQTLAAIIALAATFVVFKLNFLSEQIRKSRNDLSRFILLLTSFKHKEIHDIEPLSDRSFVRLYEEGLTNINNDQNNLGLDPGIYKRLEKEMERIINDEWRSNFRARPNRIYGYLEMKKDILKNFLDAKRRSILLLLGSLSLTTIVIVVSLFMLPNYNFFCNPYLVLTIIMIASLVSVTLTAYSVWKIAII